MVVVYTLPRTTQGDLLICRIELLAILIARYGRMLLVVSYYPLPRSTVETGNMGETVAPRLTGAEVAELLVAYGAPGELASKITTLVASETQGSYLLS